MRRSDSRYPGGVCESLERQLSRRPRGRAASSRRTSVSSLVGDRGRAAGAAVARRRPRARAGEPLAVLGDQLEPVGAGLDPVVDHRQDPRGPALVAVDVADLLAAGQLERRGVEVLAVGDRERLAVGVGELAVVAEREPDRARRPAPPRRARRRPAARAAARAPARRRGRIASATRASNPAAARRPGRAAAARRRPRRAARRRARHVRAVGEVVQRPARGPRRRRSRARARRRARAAARSRRSSHPSLARSSSRPARPAELLHRGADSGLRGPERDLLDRADLARRVAEQRRQQQRSALLARAARRAPRAARRSRPTASRARRARQSSTAPARRRRSRPGRAARCASRAGGRSPGCG